MKEQTRDAGDPRGGRVTCWQERLKEQNIAVLGAPSRLPVEADIARTEARLKVAFPESYRTFCTEIGPGRFGDLLEIWVPWHAKGFFQSPCDIRSRLTSLMDATGGGRQSLAEKAIHFGYVVLGGPPSPRVISGRSADLFFLPSESTGVTNARSTRSTVAARRRARPRGW